MQSLKCAAGALLIWLMAVAGAYAQTDVPPQYQQYFKFRKGERGLFERTLNRLDVSLDEIGPLFVLVAGVDEYPNLPLGKRALDPATEDLDKLVNYFSKDSAVMELVVLRNRAVNYTNFAYFLDEYFPDRLSSIPQSRFIFAYSGHGIEDDGRGYLVLSDAHSMESPTRRLKLESIKSLYDKVVDSAYQSLILLNACYAGTFHQRYVSFGEGESQYFIRKPGHHAITAGSSSDSEVWHLEHVGGGSVFFEKFLAAVEGYADKSPIDGLITIQELFTYVQSETVLATNGHHTPQMGDISEKSDNGGMFFINPDYEGPYPRQLEQSKVSTRPVTFGGDDCGTATACLRQADELLASGMGYFRAIAIYEEACQKASGEACAQLGDIYRQGKIVPANTQVANQFDQHACELGVGKRCKPVIPLPEMLRIDPGTFQMGDLQGDGYSDERPVHTVSIQQAFEVGKYEVSFDEYDRFARATGRDLPDDEGWGRGQRPVINVNWNNAVAYAGWLSTQTGRQYRLLSEAEWEYVTRAGTATPFSTGNCINTDQANYNGNVDYADCGANTGVYRQQTMLVDALPPNPWGLHHVHGNVYEWTQDCWHKNYEGAPDDGSAWLEDDAGNCNRRVLRGGRWGSIPWGVRSADRFRFNSGEANNGVGFRLARTL